MLETETADTDLLAGGALPGGRPLPFELYVAPADIEKLQAGQRTPSLVREVLHFSRAPEELVRRLAAPSLVLFRAVATPSLETLRFFKLAQEADRSPVILELAADWFTPSVNHSKRRLAKLAILRGDGEVRVRARSVSVTSFNARGRERLRDLTCTDGRPFLQFHHEMLEALGGRDALAAVIDATDFYGADTPREHYERAFALYTCFGALAESFAFSGPELAFTEQVVLPAFEATVRRFGARPALVELLPHGEEMDPYWESYPPEALPFALRAAGR